MWWVFLEQFLSVLNGMNGIFVFFLLFFLIVWIKRTVYSLFALMKRVAGLRLLYVFLATDYPIDDQQAVLQLQIKSLDLLDVMPIVNKNQVNDSHLAATVEKIASKVDVNSCPSVSVCL